MKKNLILILLIISIVIISGCAAEKSAIGKKIKAASADSQKKLATVEKSACESKLNGKSEEVKDERLGVSTTTQVCMPYDEDLLKCGAETLGGCWTKTTCESSGGIFCPSKEAVSNANRVACYKENVAPCKPNEIKPEECTTEKLFDCKTLPACELSGGFWDAENNFCKEPEKSLEEVKTGKPNLVLASVSFVNQEKSSIVSPPIGSEVIVQLVIRNDESIEAKGPEAKNKVVIKRNGDQTEELYILSQPLGPNKISNPLYSDKKIRFEKPGQYCLDVILDSENLIEESIEENSYPKQGCVSVGGSKTLLQWNFEEEKGSEVIDSSDTKKTGSLSGFSDTDSSRVPGFYGHSAMKFDGIDDSIKLNKQLTIGSDITLSFVIRAPKILPEAEQEIVALKGKSTSKIVLGKQGIGFIQNGKSVYTDISRGKWSHVVVRSKNSGSSQATELFMNGESKTSGEFDLQNSETVGIVLGGESKYFAGIIDDFRVFDSAIPDKDISDLYKGYGNPSELVLNWKADEGSGELLKDSSGLENNGLISGASWTTGISKTGLKFDGADDYVSGEELTLRDKDDFAVTLYVKISQGQNPEKEQYIIQTHGGKTGSGEEPVSGIVYSQNGFGLSLLTETGKEAILAKDIPLGEWFTVKGVWKKSGSGVTVSLFINGNLKGTKTTGLLKSGGLNVILGSSSKGEFFNGEIDEVRVYSGADVGSKRCKTDSDCEVKEKCKTDSNICFERPSCKKLIDNGDSKNRVDVALIYDGVIQDSEFEKKASAVFNYDGEKQAGLFSIEPLKSNKKKFNLWLAPTKGQFLDSPDKTTSITPNIEKTNDILAKQCPHVEYGVVLSPQTFRSFSLKNIILLSENYGGSTGAAKISNRLAHELGHSIFGLADEYAEKGKDKKPRKPNCAPNKDTAKKWWGGFEGKEGVGYFEGCSYTDDNIRGTSNSLMRDIQMENPDFGLVSSKHMQYVLERYNTGEKIK